MFETFELSRFAARPVHYFLFSLQGKTWRFNSTDRDIVLNGNTYVGGQMQRSEIKVTSERAKDKLTITLAYLRDPNAPAFPSTQPLGDLWHPYIPSDTVYVTCMSGQYGDTDPPSVEWMGQVTQPVYGDVELQLTCTPTSDLDLAVNQGARWQVACWKSPYSTGLRGCNMLPDDFEVPATLTAVDGLRVTAAAFGAAPLSLAGASLRWVRADGIVERRSVMDQAGSVLTLLYGAADLAPGLNVVVRPGCPRTWAACLARNNTDHYGGAIYKPVDNPMNGVSMSWG